MWEKEKNISRRGYKAESSNELLEPVLYLIIESTSAKCFQGYCQYLLETKTEASVFTATQSEIQALLLNLSGKFRSFSGISLFFSHSSFFS